MSQPHGATEEGLQSRRLQTPGSALCVLFAMLTDFLGAEPALREDT